MTSYRDIAEEAARQAGRVLLGHLGRLRGVETKGGQPTNLVTVADRESERTIIEVLRAAHPDHGFLGEESGAHARDAAFRWIIDPLDGTTNFTHAFPVFSVSIALEHAGSVICGVVYDPVRDELFAAERGRGATLNGVPIHVSDRADIEQCMLVTGFPYNVRENPDRCFERFITFLLHAQAVRRLGSAALDCAYVAAGRLDGFWEVALQPWDKAAGALLIEEAGGRVTGFLGEAHDLFAPPFLGSNGFIHDAMVRILADAERLTISHR